MGWLSPGYKPLILKTSFHPQMTQIFADDSLLCLAFARHPQGDS
jgi:hypothetical protein